MLATKTNPIDAIAPHLRLAAETEVASRVGFDARLTAFATIHSALVLRLSLALVYCGFGALKLFPGASPAEHLAGETIRSLSLGLLGPALSLPLLGIFELAIGAALLVVPKARFTVPTLLIHLAGTLTPLFLFPHETFTHFPAPTLVGQYILKNVVLAAAAVVLLGAPARR